MANFVLDANIFIEAHRVYYPIDVAESFWLKIKTLAEEDKIISIDRVKNEIYQNDDELTEWMKANLSDEFFKSTDEVDILNEYGNVATWAESRSDHYKRNAIDEFLEYERADAWLVAYCKTHDDILVSHEASNSQRKNRILLPQPCQHFGIAYQSIIELFRALGVRF